VSIPNFLVDISGESYGRQSQTSHAIVAVVSGQSPKGCECAEEGEGVLRACCCGGRLIGIIISGQRYQEGNAPLLDLASGLWRGIYADG
jgi:hypothetical protein